MTTREGPAAPVRSRRGRLAFGAIVALALVGAPAAYWAAQQPGIVLRLGRVADSPLRKAYEAEVAALSARAAEMEGKGVPLPQIARTLYEERRALGIKYKDMTPWPLRQRIFEINKERYGDPYGPSWDYLLRKHTRDGAVDYRGIIEGASRANPDIDRLLRKGR